MLPVERSMSVGRAVDCQTDDPGSNKKSSHN